MDLHAPRAGADKKDMSKLALLTPWSSDEHLAAEHPSQTRLTPIRPRPLIRLFLSDLEGPIHRGSVLHGGVACTLARIRDTGVPVITLAHAERLSEETGPTSLGSEALASLIDRIELRDAELDPGLFRRLDNLYAVAALHSLYVSSSADDLAVARWAGWHTAWAAYDPDARLRASGSPLPGPEVVLRDFAALFDHYEFEGDPGGGPSRLALAS